MRIGFTSIYSWRPHVEHMYYLARLAQQAGHEARFLTCDADLPACYAREMRPQRAGWLHCTMCRAGGIRSYAGSEVDSIGRLGARLADVPARGDQWSRSSASTLGRFEAPAEFDSPEFHALAQRLDPSARLGYAAARRWIDKHRLDAVFVFNGRMDATRGVLEAAHDAGVPAVSTERTWFGDGIQLLPEENCLGLRAVDRMMAAWRDVPLSRDQALRAAGHVASRFLRRNSKEWRAYNTTARAEPWPVPHGRRRLLLVPGSINEVWSHPDWALGWPELTRAFDAVIDCLGLQPADVVLRCHPNWGERIGARDGSLSERYFSDWAHQRGIHVIASTDSTSTLGLIEQSDAIIVCGGSAALEAGVLGKQVIAVAPSIYQQAGFQTTVYAADQLAVLTLHADLSEAPRTAAQALIARQTLRFCYTNVYRTAQFVPFVHSVETTRYEYRDGADPDRLTRLLLSRELEADDPEASLDTAGEDEVMSMIRARAWEALVDSMPPSASPVKTALKRRWMFRPVDRLREALPRGDL